MCAWQMTIMLETADNDAWSDPKVKRKTIRRSARERSQPAKHAIPAWGYQPISGELVRFLFPYLTLDVIVLVSKSGGGDPEHTTV